MYAGHRLIVTQGRKGPHPEYLVIGITNIGHREAQITGVGWRIGVLRKQLADQTLMLNDGISSPMPSRLRDGDEAKYYIPLFGEAEWLRDFTPKMLLPRPAWNLWFARVRVYTSVGKVFEARLEPGLRRRLIEFAKKIQSP